MSADNAAYSWKPSAAGAYGDSSKTIDPEADMGLAAGSKYTFYSVIFDSTTLTDESQFFVTKELANKTVPVKYGTDTQFAVYSRRNLVFGFSVYEQDG